MTSNELLLLIFVIFVLLVIAVLLFIATDFNTKLNIVINLKSDQNIRFFFALRLSQSPPKMVSS